MPFEPGGVASGWRWFGWWWGDFEDWSVSWLIKFYCKINFKSYLKAFTCLFRPTQSIRLLPWRTAIRLTLVDLWAFSKVLTCCAQLDFKVWIWAPRLEVCYKCTSETPNLFVWLVQESSPERKNFFDWPEGHYSFGKVGRQFNFRYREKVLNSSTSLAWDSQRRDQHSSLRFHTHSFCFFGDSRLPQTSKLDRYFESNNI